MLLPVSCPQLARRDFSGSPKFPSSLSSRAMRFDPGRSPASSPVALASVLGSADATASPPACSTVSRLDGLSGVRRPLTACEVPCVRFSNVVRLASPAATLACPSFKQHSVLGGWLSLSIQSFRSEPCHVYSMPSWRDFHPQSRRPLLGAPHFSFLRGSSAVPPFPLTPTLSLGERERGR